MVTLYFHARTPATSSSVFASPRSQPVPRCASLASISPLRERLCSPLGRHRHDLDRTSTATSSAPRGYSARSESCAGSAALTVACGTVVEFRTDRFPSSNPLVLCRTHPSPGTDSRVRLLSQHYPRFSPLLCCLTARSVFGI